MATVRETGEFGLISRLARVVGEQPGLVRGIGDDAAIWRQPAAGMVATTDMLIEGVHFDLTLTGWRDLGWKALAVNLSDIAAMGAAPHLALVSLGLRGDTLAGEVEAFYDGMRDLAARTGCAIAGGDTVSVRHDVAINVTVLGRVHDDETETLLRRDAGRAGDVVAVTGCLGASAGGLWALRGRRGAAAPSALIDAHIRPTPRVEAGQVLRRAGVRCAIDVSDGLLADLLKLCAASGCSADVRVDDVPVHPAALALAPDRALDWALGGGEDYELVCAAPAEVIERARDEVRRAGVALTAIGALVSPAAPRSDLTGGVDPSQTSQVRLLDRSGRERTSPAAGWDHFSRAE